MLFEERSEYTLWFLLKGDWNRRVEIVANVSTRLKEMYGDPPAEHRWSRHLTRTRKVRLALQQSSVSVILYRLAHAAYRRRLPLIPGILSSLNLSLHGVDIAPEAVIGPGFFMAHTVGTVMLSPG